MNRSDSSIVAVCGMLLAVVALAEPVSISLDQAVRDALSRNPRLIALGTTRDAMRERPAQATGLPNPMFTYRGMDATTGGAFPNTSEKRFEIEQPLPGYGKRGLREAVSVNEAGAMGAEAEMMAQEVIWMVKEAAYELQAVQKALLITRSEDDLLIRMAKVAEVRYAAGEAAQADAVKAQTEITMLKQKRLELEGREKTLRAKLAFLMNIDADQAPATIIATIPDGPLPDSVALVKLPPWRRPIGWSGP